MREGSLGTLRMILYAAARVLGCGSALLALVDQERDVLALRIAIATRDEPMRKEVEALLGFSPDGVAIPMSQDGILVRAVREGRLLVTGRFADITGNTVGEDVAAQIQSLIGVQTFAAVPMLGRAGPLGVVLFQKAGESGFPPSDRDLLVAYADRLGAALESQEIDAEVEALESLGDVGSPPPTIHLCDGELRTTGSDGAQIPLAEVLRARVSAQLLAEAASRVGEAARTLAVATDDQRLLRLTLKPVPGGFVAVSEDVGWLERLSREAARTRDQLANVLSSVGDAIFTLDRHGTIVGCNAAVRAAFGHAPGELLGRSISTLIAGERALRRVTNLEGRLVADGFAELELPFLRAGRKFPASVSALLLADDDGGPAGALWRVRDLSERRRGVAERKRLRARLLQSERLSALGEMAARIAHEVRNPLVSIGAAALFVEEELAEAGFESSGAAAAGPGRGAVRDEVRAIRREVVRLDAIVSGFLHFARPRPARREPVDLLALVRETVLLVQARKAVPVVVEGDERSLARCDPDGIRQVLWNVLTNALDASPSDGSVRCEVRLRGERVEISVSDDGPGIASDIRRRVFDPFFSTKARGTGLGLSISRQIVEEHRGRIRLSARRRGGTTFLIDLPT